MKEVDTVKLELATSPEMCLYKDRLSGVYTTYPFDRVTGIDVNGMQIGEAGEATTVLCVPETWAQALVGYTSEHMLETTRRFVFRKRTVVADHPRTNCHGFASYMSEHTGQPVVRPDAIVSEGEKLTDLQAQPQFGDWLAFGAQGPPYDASPRPCGRNQSVRRFNAAYHSAIALGEVSAGMCIQVTSSSGVLALDELERYQGYVRTFDRFDDDLSWFRSI